MLLIFWLIKVLIKKTVKSIKSANQILKSQWHKTMNKAADRIKRKPKQINILIINNINYPNPETKNHKKECKTVSNF